MSTSTEPRPATGRAANDLESFVGEIRIFAGDFAPVDWSICDGSQVAINAYPELFAVIGTTFGGDGKTTFGLPDFRGRLPVGIGLNETSGTRYLLGQTGGAETTTSTVANMPAHDHGGSITFENVTLFAHTINGMSGTPFAQGSLATSHALNSSGYTPKTYVPNADTDSVVQLGGAEIGISGSSQSGVAGAGYEQLNLMPTMPLTFIIALRGIFPPRP